MSYVKTKPDRISKRGSRCGFLLRCIQLCLIDFAESEYWNKWWKWNSILCNAINESDTFPRHHSKRSVCSVFWNRFVIACVLSRKTTKHHCHYFFYFLFFFAGSQYWSCWNQDLKMKYFTFDSTLQNMQRRPPNELSTNYFINRETEFRGATT